MEREKTSKTQTRAAWATFFLLLAALSYHQYNFSKSALFSQPILPSQTSEDNDWGSEKGIEREAVAVEMSVGDVRNMEGVGGHLMNDGDNSNFEGAAIEVRNEGRGLGDGEIVVHGDGMTLNVAGTEKGDGVGETWSEGRNIVDGSTGRGQEEQRGIHEDGAHVGRVDDIVAEGQEGEKDGQKELPQTILKVQGHSSSNVAELGSAAEAEKNVSSTQDGAITPSIDAGLTSNANVGVSNVTKPASNSSPHSNGAESECATYIVYDKPMKTGSTAVTQALKELLSSVGTDVKFAACDMVECQELARSICAGVAEPVHLLQHIHGENGLLECLREKGYYVMTSIREPFERWESAYLYNQKQEARHYGVSWTESYEVFMSRIPPCALYGYYDGGSRQCVEDVDKRLENIVGRYDEIVNLYDSPKGMVEKLLERFAKEVNKSPREGEFRGKFDTTRLQNETKLYRALRAKREELIKTPRQKFCA